MTRTGTFALLERQDDVGHQFGLAGGVHLYSRAIRVAGDLQYWVTCGTRLDHINRVFTLLAEDADRVDVEAWARARLADVAAEYSEPWRRLLARAGPALQAAAAAGATSWPPEY